MRVRLEDGVCLNPTGQHLAGDRVDAAVSVFESLLTQMTELAKFMCDRASLFAQRNEEVAISA